MPATLAVPPAFAESLSAFVGKERLPLAVVAGTDGTVQVVAAAAGRQSSPAVLQAGGWIACSTAFRTAAALGIDPRDVGKLLDQLDIKIRACQLGCFA